MLNTNVPLQEMPLSQLKAIDHSMEMFLFAETGGEQYEPSFKKDPKQFKKLISEMVSFKSDLMGYFRKQFDNRYNLVNQYVVKWDEYEDYLYAEQWNKDQAELAALIENHTSQSYDLGVLALALTLGISFDYGYQEYQKQLLKKAELSAQTITDTTQRRVKRAIQAAMELKEDRTAFDQRLKSVFLNPYRGRFIAQQESLDAYMEGKEGLAVDQELTHKEALSSQAKDKLCGSVNGQKRKISEKFSNGFLKPLFHYGCRCDIRYFREE